MRILFCLFILIFGSSALWTYSSWETRVVMDQNFTPAIRSQCYLKFSSFRFFFGGDFTHRNPEDFTLAASLDGFYLGPLERAGLYRFMRSEKGISWSVFEEKSSVDLNRDSRNSLNQGIAWQKRWGGLFLHTGVDQRSVGLHLTTGSFQAVLLITENFHERSLESESWYESEKSGAGTMFQSSLAYDLDFWGLMLNTTLSTSPQGAPSAAGALQGRWKIASFRLSVLAVAYTPSYRSASGELVDIRSQIKSKQALPLGDHILIKQKGTWTWLSDNRNWESSLSPSIHWIFSRAVDIGLEAEWEGSSTRGWLYPVPEISLKGEALSWGGSFSFCSNIPEMTQRFKGRIRYRHMELQMTMLEESSWSFEKAGFSWSHGAMDFSCMFEKDFRVLECTWRWKF